MECATHTASRRLPGRDHGGDGHLVGRVLCVPTRRWTNPAPHPRGSVDAPSGDAQSQRCRVRLRGCRLDHVPGAASHPDHQTDQQVVDAVARDPDPGQEVHLLLHDRHASHSVEWTGSQATLHIPRVRHGGRPEAGEPRLCSRRDWVQGVGARHTQKATRPAASASLRGYRIHHLQPEIQCIPVRSVVCAQPHPGLQSAHQDTIRPAAIHAPIPLHRATHRTPTVGVHRFHPVRAHTAQPSPDGWRAVRRRNEFLCQWSQVREPSTHNPRDVRGCDRGRATATPVPAPTSPGAGAVLTSGVEPRDTDHGRYPHHGRHRGSDSESESECSAPGTHPPTHPRPIVP